MWDWQPGRLPVGATVTLKCTGKRCPLKSLTIKRSRKSTMNVLNAKAMRKKKTYRAGQTVDVRIAAPGMNTKVLRFKLRTGKVPKTVPAAASPVPVPPGEGRQGD